MHCAKTPTLFICNKFKFQFYHFFLLFGHKMQSNVDFHARKSFSSTRSVSTAKTLTSFLRFQLIHSAKNRVKSLGVNFPQLIQGLRNRWNKSLCVRENWFLQFIWIALKWLQRDQVQFSTHLLHLRLYFTDGEKDNSHMK